MTKCASPTRHAAAATTWSSAGLLVPTAGCHQVVLPGSACCLFEISKLRAGPCCAGSPNRTGSDSSPSSNDSHHMYVLSPQAAAHQAAAAASMQQGVSMFPHYFQMPPAPSAGSQVSITASVCELVSPSQARASLLHLRACPLNARHPQQLVKNMASRPALVSCQHTAQGPSGTQASCCLQGCVLEPVTAPLTQDGCSGHPGWPS